MKAISSNAKKGKANEIFFNNRVAQSRSEPPLTSEGRKWRVRPHDLASDYSQIIDQRPGTEVVAVYWIAPKTMDANMPNVEAFKAILREHMLVGIAHGSAAQAGR
jgi:hypothetical protein